MRVAVACIALLAGCTPVLPAPVARPSPSVAPSSMTCEIYADIALPASEGDVKVSVFNASQVAGLGQQAGDDLAARGFVVLKVSGKSSGLADKVAVIRYGPRAVGKATLVNAYFLGQAQMVYDATRQDDTVDVVVGATYRQLASAVEEKQAVAMMGLPQAPPGTCPSPEAPR